MAHSQPIPISKWLPTIHPSFDTYTELLTDFGYEDTGILLSADLHDLQRDLEEMGVKKPHFRLLLKKVKQLKEREGIDSGRRQRPKGNGVSAMIEVDLVPLNKPTKARESSARKRLESYSKTSAGGAQAQQVHAKEYVEKLSKAEARKLDQLETKRAFAAAQNLKTETVHIKQKVQNMVQPAVKKTGTEHKLQAATERKQQVAGKKAAFARSDSLKADEAATKQKLKQAIKPAVMKTAQDRKLEEAQWRKKESSNKKAAFARSDSLKSDEIYAKNKVQECIRPAVAKAAIDDKVKAASGRKAGIQAKKAAFARSNSLKTMAALERKSSSAEKQKRQQEENMQRVANAAERKGKHMERKRAFARSDSLKVEEAKRSGAWVHITSEDENSHECSSERICQLGASMSWGMGQ